MTTFTFATAVRPCACSQVSLIAYDATGNAESAEHITTGCDETTKRTFAPGHDARLKGLLIRGAIEGHEAAFSDGGMLTSMDPIALAESFGFGWQVKQGLQNGLAKAEAKAARQAAKAAKVPAQKKPKAKKAKAVTPAVTVVDADAKIGRWVKQGTFCEATGEFSYVDASGNRINTTKFTALNLH